MKVSIRALTLAYLEAKKPERIDRAALTALRRAVATQLGPERRVSERYLVEVLLETRVPIDEALGGIAVDLRGRIRTRDPEAALKALAELGDEYAEADAPRRRELRTAVLRAKDRLQRRLAKPPESGVERAALEELRAALLTWLENPPVFSTWLGVRKRPR